MESQLAEIEHSVIDDTWTVHGPDGNNIRFPEFKPAQEYCYKQGWDVVVIESNWDEEFSEWH